MMELCEILSGVSWVHWAQFFATPVGVAIFGGIFLRLTR